MSACTCKYTLMFRKDWTRLPSILSFPTSPIIVQTFRFAQPGTYGFFLEPFTVIKRKSVSLIFPVIHEFHSKRTRSSIACWTKWRCGRSRKAVSRRPKFSLINTIFTLHIKYFHKFYKASIKSQYYYGDHRSQNRLTAEYFHGVEAFVKISS